MKKQQKLYNFIYETTCNISGRYYLGRHSTSDLNDRYLGSGTQIRRSIRKHRKENHSREILAQTTNHEDLVLLEQKIVTDEISKDPHCMNLTTTTTTTTTIEKIKESAKDRIRINNGAIIKRVKVKDFGDYKKLGYMKGRV